MFKTVGLFGKYRDPSVEQPIKRLSQHLESKGVKVMIGHTTAAEIARELSQEIALETLNTDIDLAIVIGGDGTMLHVARHMADHNVPVVGVNLGHLGFLTDIAQADMLSEIDTILGGDYSIEHRMMLDVEVSRDNKSIFKQTALNDIVIGRHALEKLIAWQVKVNNQFVTNARSDGVILCTPTGSTAYALSAGGAIMHPGTDVISMVPVSPHTLSNRPITLPAASVFEFTIHNKTQNCAHVSADGLIGCNLVGDEIIKVTRSKNSARFVHTPNYDYFAMLRAKLGWGGAQPQD